MFLVSFYDMFLPSCFITRLILTFLTYYCDNICNTCHKKTIVFFLFIIFKLYRIQVVAPVYRRSSTEMSSAMLDNCKKFTKMLNDDRKSQPVSTERDSSSEDSESDDEVAFVKEEKPNDVVEFLNKEDPNDVVEFLKQVDATDATDVLATATDATDVLATATDDNTTDVLTTSTDDDTLFSIPTEIKRLGAIDLFKWIGKTTNNPNFDTVKDTFGLFKPADASWLFKHTTFAHDLLQLRDELTQKACAFFLDAREKKQITVSQEREFKDAEAKRKISAKNKVKRLELLTQEQRVAKETAKEQAAWLKASGGATNADSVPKKGTLKRAETLQRKTDRDEEFTKDLGDFLDDETLADGRNVQTFKAKTDRIRKEREDPDHKGTVYNQETEILLARVLAKQDEKRAQAAEKKAQKADAAEKKAQKADAAEKEQTPKRAKPTQFGNADLMKVFAQMVTKLEVIEKNQEAKNQEAKPILKKDKVFSFGPDKVATFPNVPTSPEPIEQAPSHSGKGPSKAAPTPPSDAAPNADLVAFLKAPSKAAPKRKRVPELEFPEPIRVSGRPSSILSATASLGLAISRGPSRQGSRYGSFQPSRQGSRETSPEPQRSRKGKGKGKRSRPASPAPAPKGNGKGKRSRVGSRAASPAVVAAPPCYGSPEPMQ
jgi:hypothetical protein